MAAIVQMPKVHGVDKTVNPRLKPKVQLKREAMAEPLPKQPTQSQTIPPVQPIEWSMVGQKRLGHLTSHTAPTHRPWPNPKSQTSSIQDTPVSKMPLPETSAQMVLNFQIPLLVPLSRQVPIHLSNQLPFHLQVCQFQGRCLKYLYNWGISYQLIGIQFFCLHHLHHQTHTGPLPLPDHSPGIADKPVDVDVINPALNTDLEENATQLEGIISKYYKRPGKEYLEKSSELQTQMIKRCCRDFYQNKQFRQDIENHSGKSIKRHTPTGHHTRNPSRIFNQTIFWTHIPISGTE